MSQFTLKSTERLVLLFVAGLIMITGCTGAFRSKNIQTLANKETQALNKIIADLKEAEPVINSAFESLKVANKKRIKNLKRWEKILKEANIIAASPGNLQNKVVRKAVFTQLEQLEFNRESAYDEVLTSFEIQATALNASFKKIMAAAEQVKNSSEVVMKYVNESNVNFAIQSLDSDTAKILLSDFEEIKTLLAEAAKASEQITDSLETVKITDRSQHIQEFAETLVLVSGKLKELQQSE